MKAVHFLSISMLMKLIVSAPIGNLKYISFKLKPFHWMKEITILWFAVENLFHIDFANISDSEIDVCTMPLRNGDERIMCAGHFERWYYTSSTGTCERFIYGGCLGNANNFLTKRECESSCVTKSFVNWSSIFLVLLISD